MLILFCCILIKVHQNFTLKHLNKSRYICDMIVLLTVSQSELVDKIPEKKVTAFNEGLLDYLRVNRADILEEIDPDAKLSDALKAKICEAAEDYVNISVGDEAPARAEEK